jgi:putative ABC transport system permease protein
MLSDYFSLALGNLKHRGIRSWLTMLGIFIGIAAVVSLISLGQGLQTAITGQFSTLSVDKLVVQSASTSFGPPGSFAVRKLNEHDIKLIESVQGVNMVISRLIRISKIEYNKAIAFGYIGSIPDTKEKTELVYEAINAKVVLGSLLNYNDYGKVVLGSNYAKEDMFGKPLRVGSKIKIQDKEFEVSGILKQSSTFQVNLIILMTEKDMKDLFNIGDETDMIVVQVQDKNKINEVATNIEYKMRKDRKEKEGEEDFSVQSPEKALGAVNTILNIINLIVSGIAAISLLVGGVGIMNTMYTSVLERTKEIGVMKAVGAQNKNIRMIFLIESGLLGLVGGIVGALIGLGFAFLASFAANTALGTTIITVNISYPLLFASIAFSLVIGLFSGILPAIQASKLNIVDAMRK